MPHLIAKPDKTFKESIEHLTFPASEFDHRAHLRLAYIYLVECPDTVSAIDSMRKTLTELLRHAGINPSDKYHETLTEAWVLAVNHFVSKTHSSSSADDFIDQNAVMLNSKIMLTHYSPEVLFSDKARKEFVEPDLDPIPRYAG